MLQGKFKCIFQTPSESLGFKVGVTVQLMSSFESTETHLCLQKIQVELALVLFTCIIIIIKFDMDDLTTLFKSGLLISLSDNAIEAIDEFAFLEGKTRQEIKKISCLNESYKRF